MFIIFLFTNILFWYFFFKINFLWWLYLVLFVSSIALLLSLFTESWKKTWWTIFKELILTYLSYLNLIVIIIWLFFVVKYLTKWYFPIIYLDLGSALIVLWALIIFYFLGLISKINSWTKLSFFWFSLIWLYIFYIVKDIKIFYYFTAFILAISSTGFLIYNIKHNKKNLFLAYIILISFLIALIILLNKYLIPNPINLSLAVQIIVMIILWFLIHIKNTYERIIKIETILKERNNELNLFWYSDIKLSPSDENFINKFKNKKSYLINLIDFLINCPQSIKVIFALTNTIPILFSSIYFFMNIWKWNYIQNELSYWIWAMIFFINFILFKKLNRFVTIQRIFAFFVVNFVTYFSIVDFFWHNYIYIASWWILWNLISTVIILLIWDKKNIFDKFDYITWTIVNFLWVFINIYFLLQINMDQYLRWWLIMLYLGLYLFIYRITYKKIFFN